MPPSRSGIADYSALLLPELEKRIDVVLARPGRFRRDPQADIALYHVGNDAEAHGWIVEALRRRPGVVVLHDFVLHHLVVGLTFARGDAAGYLAAMEREGGLVGRLLAYAVLDNKLPPLWETRPEDFPLAGEVLDHATGADRPLALRRAARARIGLPRADRADPAPGLAAARDRARRRRGRAAVRLLRPPERDQAHRGARLRVRSGCASAGPARGSCSSARWRVRLDRLELPEGVEHRDVRARGRALVADGRLRRDRLAPLADDGRDLRERDPRALARQAAGRQRRRLVRGAPGRRRDQGAGGRARGGRRCSPRSRRSPTRPSGRRWASARASWSNASTGSIASPRPTPPRWRPSPAAPWCEERVLRRGRLGRRRGRHGRRRRGRARGAAARGRPWRLAQRRRRPGRARPSSSARSRRGPGSRGLVVVSAGIRYALARRIVAPWIMVDELVYSELAKSFADGRALPAPRRAHRRLRPRLPGAAQPRVGALRPRPAGLRGGEGDQRGGRLAGGDPRLPARAPRRARARSPSAAAVLAMSVPTLLFAGMLMTENAFYPVVPARRARDGALARATRPAPNALRCSGRSCSRT